MLVSHSHKFIFLKSRKTASTSVESYFEQYCVPPGWSPVLLRETSVSEYGVVGKRGGDITKSEWFAHTPALQIKEKMGNSIWNSYFKFATARNPYDKVVSMYYMKKVKGGLPILSLEEERISFERWLLDSQYENDSNTYCIDGKVCFDDVIRYETIITDLERISNKLRVSFDLSMLPSFNSEFRPREFTSLNLYTEAGKRVVKNECRFEIEYFGYKFPE